MVHGASDGLVSSVNEKEYAPLGALIAPNVGAVDVYVPEIVNTVCVGLTVLTDRFTVPAIAAGTAQNEKPRTIATVVTSFRITPPRTPGRRSKSEPAQADAPIGYRAIGSPMWPIETTWFTSGYWNVGCKTMHFSYQLIQLYSERR